MNVFILDREYLLSELNSLPPHSRKRDGIVHVLRHLNQFELFHQQEEARVREMLVEALELELSDITAPERDRIRESF